MYQIGDHVSHPFMGDGTVIGISDGQVAYREVLVKWEFTFLGSHWCAEYVVEPFGEPERKSVILPKAPDPQCQSCKRKIPLGFAFCDLCYMSNPGVRYEPPPIT